MKSYTVIMNIALLVFAVFETNINAMHALREKQKNIAQEQIKIAKQKRMMASCTLKQIFLLDQDRQKGTSTCGPRSIYLAAALEKVISEKQEINPDNIHHALNALNFQTKMAECIPLGAQESDQFPAYIEFIRDKYHIPLLYFFSLDNDPQFGIYIGMPSSKKGDATVILQNLETELATKPLSYPIHFICNIGGHWVLFSLAQYKDKITLWYIEPTNDPISPTTKSIFETYIRAQLGLLPI